MPGAYEERILYHACEASISYRVSDISLKESNETSYWLKLMYETKRIDTATYQYAEKLCGNIRRLLIASCKRAKENAK